MAFVSSVSSLILSGALFGCVHVPVIQNMDYHLEDFYCIVYYLTSHHPFSPRRDGTRAVGLR